MTDDSANDGHRPLRNVQLKVTLKQRRDGVWEARCVEIPEIVREGQTRTIAVDNIRAAIVDRVRELAEKKGLTPNN